MTQLERALAHLRSAGVEVRTLGDGPPLLFLHGEDGLLFNGDFVDLLAGEFTVLAPSHPGWAGSPRTPEHRSLDDIAYLYLDLLEGIGERVPVVGCSLGGWLALELATKSTQYVSCLALLAPVGIRTGEPTARHYLDRYAVPAEVLAGALYGAPGRQPDLAVVGDDDLLHLARAQEATAFYAWQPYLHNPSLPQRLHRVRCPVQLIAGESDRFIIAGDHYRTLASHLGGPTEQLTVGGVGHRIEEQAPEQAATAVTQFIHRTTAQPGTAAQPGTPAQPGTVAKPSTTAKPSTAR
jgi:pimeloyl-ACP methyl ester carboxylesterase